MFLTEFREWVLPFPTALLAAAFGLWDLFQQVVQTGSYFRQGPSELLDHATSEIASGSKLGIDARKKLPGEGCKRAWWT